VLLLLMPFQVAIEGCCHGELDNIYATLAHLEKAEGRKVDLLICCGDFQVRTSHAYYFQVDNVC
jgi:lariat debranching enzyme